MYEYKKGFTLVEVVLVMVLIIAMFSMSLAILSSFSKPNYHNDDVGQIKDILGQIKYLKLIGEKDITVRCNESKISIYLGLEVINEKHLSKLSCLAQVATDPFSMEFSNGSSTLNVKINQYGYVLFKGI